MKKPLILAESEPSNHGNHRQKILISACLLGHEVRFDGSHCRQDSTLLQQWQDQARLIIICPEMAAGLPSPRPPAEITNGHALSVLSGHSPVLTESGQDVSRPFLIGAQAALALARQHRIRMAILKEKSPSCGMHHVYNGHFDGQLVRGSGIATALLIDHGIRVFNENELTEAHQFLQRLEHLPANEALRFRD